MSFSVRGSGNASRTWAERAAGGSFPGVPRTTRGSPVTPVSASLGSCDFPPLLGVTPGQGGMGAGGVVGNDAAQGCPLGKDSPGELWGPDTGVGPGGSSRFTQGPV